MDTSTAPSNPIARWVLGARPRTLPAAVVPVVVGVGAAAGAGPVGGGIVWWRVAGALVVAVALQVGVNYANDYSDGVRGTDADRVGPIRLVASGLAEPGAVKRAAFVAFGVAAVAGLIVAIATAWWLILVGMVCIAAAWTYTGGPRPYGYAGLGEVVVFVFFGLVATAGTTFVAVERITWVSVVAGAGVGALACALLVVNNLRDRATDATAGKRTLAVRIGDVATRRVYAVLVLLAFVAVVAVVPERPAALIALLALLLAIAPVRSVLTGAAGRELVGVLGATGMLHLAYGVLFGIGLALSG